MGNYGLESKDGRDIVIAIIVLGWISIFTTILRVAARKMRNISLGLDDYCMLVALVCPLTSLGWWLCLTKSAVHGDGIVDSCYLKYVSFLTTKTMTTHNWTFSAVTKGGVGHHAITMEKELGPHMTYVGFADIEFVLKV